MEGEEIDTSHPWGCFNQSKGNEMGRVTKQVFECVCDRCKKEGDTENGHGAQEFGGMTIKYNGHISGRTWQGDAAGVVHKGDKWLCLDCTKAFVAFMSNPTNGN